MITALRVRDREIEGHAAKEFRPIALLLEVRTDIERQAIDAGDEWTVQQIADAAVRIGLARALGICALASLEAPQRYGDAGGGLAARGIEDVR